ncbi:MAG: hypothetical protein NWQ28_07975 [Nodularia sp. (in: cyanobacteria)]|nr:hypothetical protein [Nodularia sp. (in: cyanobacteria)]
MLPLPLLYKHTYIFQGHYMATAKKKQATPDDSSVSSVQTVNNAIPEVNGIIQEYLDQIALTSVRIPNNPDYLG